MLTRMEVELSGGWDPPVDGNLRWNGEVHCDRPFVGLLVGSAKDRLYWAKTEVCQPPTFMSLTLHPLRAPLETQLMFHVGSGYLTRMIAAVHPQAAAVRIVLPERVETGVRHGLFVILSNPSANLGALFLAREDVKVGRTGVWRPKAGVDRSLLPSDLLIPLQCAGNGDIEIPRGS